MWDLYLSIAIIWTASVVVFFLAERWSKKLTQNLRTLVSLALVALGSVFVIYIRDNVVLARLMPFSGLIVLGQWLPVFCLALAGVASSTPNQHRIRRLLPVIGLSVVAIYATLRPIAGKPPACHSSWDGDVCLQSSWHTCSAASAVTLLRHHGIESSEEELARMCLTRKGTTWQGLFRGLKLHTTGTNWSVHVASPSIAELRTASATPAIISVGAPHGGNVDPIYEQQYGWPPGLLHSVVLLGFNEEGRPEIADPSIGRESWSLNDLEVLYRGVATRLVPLKSH